MSREQLRHLAHVAAPRCRVQWQRLVAIEVGFYQHLGD